MHELFKKISHTLPEPDDCKNKRQMLLTDTVVQSYINKLQF